jgi:deoxyadenosine/deoxycytidine kinase
MQIIIDGNDGIGKTTLAKKLMADLGIKSYIHLSGQDPRTFEFYKAMLSKQDVIFDRSFMDELIYSEVLDRTPMLTEAENEMLHMFVASNDFYVIICHSDTKRYDADESQKIIDKSADIDHYFEAVLYKHSRYPFDYVSFDTMKDDYNLLLENIKWFFI